MRRALNAAIDMVLSPLSQRHLSYLESRIALKQGKGWGAGTITQEISACCSLLAGTPRLLLDIGGNRGAYAKEFLRRFPDGIVHIFEPSPHNIIILKDAFAANPRVSVAGFALSDAPGRFALYSDAPGSGLASLSQRRLSHFGIEMNEEAEVDVIRFDEYWRECAHSLPEIDYVKIDVEGHELSVLKGFGELLESVKLIQFEFGGCNIDTRTFFQDFWYFFCSRNFSIYRITPCGPAIVSRYMEIDEFFAATNFVAVNNRYLP